MEKRLIPKKKYNWLDVLAALILLFFFAGFTVSRQIISPWGVLFFFRLYDTLSGIFNLYQMAMAIRLEKTGSKNWVSESYGAFF